MRSYRVAMTLGALIPLLGAALWPIPARANPTSVTVAGDLQSELGCPGDFQPDCAMTHLIYDASDDVWQRSFSLPAGIFSYKVALDDSWSENYPVSNVALELASPATVKFYYDDTTHTVADNVSSVIATVAGDFQSELGCPGDWQPDCLRSWLEDPNGTGVHAFTTDAIPAGDYQGKVAINESWSENYGVGGAPDGASYDFHVAASGDPVSFRYDGVTHLLTIETPEPGPTAAALAGLAALRLRFRRSRTR